jgi:phage terminase large subunit-like protein
MAEPSVAELKQVLAGLQALEYRRTYQQLLDFKPYPKQREFLDLGAAKSERLLIAGNQNGKTHVGAYEVACHMTGLYPKEWKGRRFERPTRGWIAGETSLVVRDVQQKKLCGEPGVEAAFGTGMIPKGLFVDKPSLARGITDAYDTIQVRHVSGGVSVARFKSYEQGRQKFQGESLDWLWFDEEPPMQIYSEGLTRTAATKGICFMTFTPLLGPTDVVTRFLEEPSPYRGVVAMKIEEAEHISQAERERLMASWPDHEREARAHGVPMLGEGKIFRTSEAAITEAPIRDVPIYWRKIWGIDIGIGHPFAAVLLLWEDPDGADIIHVHHAIRIADATPIIHAAAMKPVAEMVPVAYPKDAGDREKGTGEPISKLYKDHDLVMLDAHATHEGGGLSTDAGLFEWDEREKTGRLKVAAHLSDWFDERRFYHRKDGKIVKIKDDLMSATRVGLMMKRYARGVPLGKAYNRNRSGGGVVGVDFDVFA